MKTLVNTANSLISQMVKIVLLTVLVASFTSPAYTYTQKELWEHLDTKTHILYKRGQYTEAVNVAKEVLKVAEDTFGSEHPNVALSLNNLAVLYRAQGKYAEAEPLLKRALEIYEKAFGSDNLDVATSLNNLAGLYRAQGNMPKLNLLTNEHWQ